jgi:hypothetical protein
MSGREQRQRSKASGIAGGKTKGDGPAVGVAQDDGLLELERVQEAGDYFRGRLEVSGDVRTALREACAGEIESDDVVAAFHLLHERKKGGGRAHEPVKKDERGCSLHRRSFFEVGQLQAIEMKMTAFGHCRSFFQRMFGAVCGLSLTKATAMNIT